MRSGTAYLLHPSLFSLLLSPSHHQIVYLNDSVLPPKWRDESFFKVLLWQLITSSIMSPSSPPSSLPSGSFSSPWYSCLVFSDCVEVHSTHFLLLEIINGRRGSPFSDFHFPLSYAYHLPLLMMLRSLLSSHSLFPQTRCYVRVFLRT